MDLGRDNVVWGKKVQNCSFKMSESYGCGILLDGENNTLCGNNVSYNRGNGINLEFYFGSSNRIADNVIENNSLAGIQFDRECLDNEIKGNNITRNRYGIYFESESSTNNTLYHNNFVQNTEHVPTFYYLPIGSNTWDDDYPSGGNYWGGFPVVDIYKGRDQNEPGSDGINDTQYKIDGKNSDRCPLTGPYIKLITDVNDDGIVNMIDVTTVTVTFNSRAGDLRYNPRADMDMNWIINIVDVTIVAKDFGKESWHAG